MRINLSRRSGISRMAGAVAIVVSFSLLASYTGIGNRGSGVARAQSEPGAQNLIQSVNAQYAEVWRRAFERGDLAEPGEGQPAVAVFNIPIPGVVESGTAIELVDGNVGFTEGPVGTPDGGLFFSAVMANRIYRIPDIHAK